MSRLAIGISLTGALPLRPRDLSQLRQNAACQGGSQNRPAHSGL
jgi:hypothetical protein